jgi:hypothetical protein
MKIKLQNRILKQAKKGFRGYPVATVAYYGPDDQRASKVAVGIFRFEGASAVMRKWYTGKTDARLDEQVTNEVMEHIRNNGALTIASVAKILGCLTRRRSTTQKEELARSAHFGQTKIGGKVLRKSSLTNLRCSVQV